MARIFASFILLISARAARTLSRAASLPRPQIYRTLNELQKKGVIESEIAVPYKFRGISIDEALQILMTTRLNRYKEAKAKTKELLQKFQKFNEIEHKGLNEQEFKLVVIEGRERILQIMKRQHAKVQRSVDIISTMPRWLQIYQHCFEDYVKALDRNVKYRLILEENDLDNSMPENVEKLLEKRNFALRFCASRLVSNLGVFDGSEVIFNYYPSKSLKESPIIWTNHPSLIMMAQDHFNTIWKSSKEHS